MKQPMALMNPDTGRFWDGNVPLAPHGWEGKVPYMYARWRPKFRTEPKVFINASTVERRWAAYEAMREVNPDLPRLVQVPVRVSHKILEGRETFELPEKERVAARIKMLFGQHTGESWMKGNYTNANCYYVNVELPPENFPNYEQHGYGHFLTFDERALLRFIQPRAKVTDVSAALGTEPLPCELTDPYPKQNLAEAEGEG
jgi:hypothetical protein